MACAGRARSVLRKLLLHFVDRDRHLASAAGGVDAHDAFADALSDPEPAVGTVRNFPRILEAARDDARREPLGRVRPHRAWIHVRAGSDLCESKRPERTEKRGYYRSTHRRHPV